MARKSRFILLGVPQHVIQHGHNRESCLYSEDGNRCYLDNFHEAATNNCVSIHAYFLMTNYILLSVAPAH